MLTVLFHNLSATQTIFKNTFWLSVGTVANKLLSLALVIYAARILGVQEYGQFTFALAFASLLMIFSDLGLSPIVTREFAREEVFEGRQGSRQAKEEFYSILSLKLLLTFGTFLFVLLASFFLVSGQDTRMIILILATFFLMNSFIGICYSFFHARQKMEYEALFETAQVLMILGFGVFALMRFPSPENLSYAHFFSALVVSILVLLFFHLKVFRLSLKWDVLVWKKFLKMSWPLALIGLFGALYSYTDSVMLGYWNMLEETGWYNAAYKIVTVSLVPMGLVGASFYPVLSKFSRESKEKLQKAWNFELEIMILLALPLVVGGMVLGSNIIHSFYPLEFAPSILAFQILILSAGFIFLYRPLYDAMIVLEQQSKTFWITIAGAGVNVMLNFIFIPKYSLYGAALATLVTHFLVLFIMVFFIKKFTFLQLPVLRMSLTLLISALAASVMYFVIEGLLAYNIHVFLLVFAGAVIYFLAFFILRKYLLVRYFKQIYA